MGKKEDFGCIQYIKKNKQIILSYSLNNDTEVGKIIVANLNSTKIKNDYELMFWLYVAVKRSTNSLSPTLKKFGAVIKLLSEGKQINFKTDREAKKTYIILPALENGEEEWVKIYPTSSPLGPIAKATIEYNKLIKANTQEDDNIPQK